MTETPTTDEIAATLLGLGAATLGESGARAMRNRVRPGLDGRGARRARVPGAVFPG